METVQLDPAPSSEALPGTAQRQLGATFELKEIGGRMMSVWPRYLAGADSGRHLIYVIDASNPGILPTTATELYSLLVDRGCLGRRVLVCVNKVCMPSAMTYEDVDAFCCLTQLQQAHPETDLTLLRMDTWAGIGLDDVRSWLLG
jgi:hypothetical protein